MASTTRLARSKSLSGSPMGSVLQATEMQHRCSRLSNRILLEQSGDHGRIEVGPNANDHVVSEIHHPAVAVVEAHAILGRRQRMKFDYRQVTLYDQILHVQLRALRANLTQLGERTFDKSFLAWVLAGQGMRSHHCPVHLVSHPF